MANTVSALKRVRQTEARTARNRSAKSRLKSSRRAALASIAGGNAETARTDVRSVISLADRLAKSSVLHKNTARRIQSRLAKALRAQGAAAKA